MDYNTSKATAEEIKLVIRQRINRHKLLLLEYQTPLFRDELLDAIKLHSEAFHRPDPTPAKRERALDQITVLDNMTDGLEKHNRSALLASISNY